MLARKPYARSTALRRLPGSRRAPATHLPRNRDATRTDRTRVAQLPQFDIARFDKLEAYTLAAGHAHALWLAASAPTESIDELSQAATASRTLLLSDASALSTRGIIDGQRLKDLKGPNSLRNL